jgi:predicted N-acetyltransferase YhbS
MNVFIRQETKRDFSEIFVLHSKAFGQDNEARLVNLLRNSDTFIPELSLVGVAGNRIIAHILFTRISIVDVNKNRQSSLALAPMGVLPEFQKQGIGGQLIRYGISKARQLGHRSVIVVGHEHYYPKFGFVPARKWDIKSPFDIPDNVFMAIELVRDGLKGVQGVVEYPKEFDIV